MLYGASAFRTAKPEFHSHTPSAEQPEMGSAGRAFNPRERHGPYARRSYATAGESQFGEVVDGVGEAVVLVGSNGNDGGRAYVER